MRRQHVAGVVQTSWGPTVAALLPSEAAAGEFAARLRASGDADDLDITIAQPDNRGARVDTQCEEGEPQRHEEHEGRIS